MAVHDSRDWEGVKNEISRPLRNLLEQLHFIKKDDHLFDQSPGDSGPIAFYADRGFFKEDDAIKAIADKLSLDIFHLEEHSEKELRMLLESEPANHFSPQEWRKMHAIPVFILPHEVVIAMADPLDMQAHHHLQFSFGRPINAIIGKESEILAVINASLAEVDKDAVELIVRGHPEDEKKLTSSKAVQVGQPQLESTINDDDPTAAPVVRLVNKMFAQAIAADASDLHLTPVKDGLEAKARIDGIIQPLFHVPEKLKAPVTARVKLLCGMDISERRRPQDGRLRINTNYGVKDLRISSVPSAHGENIVARILSSTVRATSFEELGATKELIPRLEHALHQTCKVHLVVGPTGSGKSSTLYAALLHLHDNTRNIITLEDPIEYRIDGITQIQVNPRIEFTFAQGLRSILRQDPDVVLVGEIRDEETASICMKSAQTGHLVLSTLHTNSAAAAITRLLDLGVPGYLISASLGSVVAQRLVRKLCDECAKKAPKKLREERGLSKDARVPVGCPKCRETGYDGRIAAYSFIEVTPEIEQAIRNGAGEDEIERLARKNGYQSLSEAAFELVQKGITSLEELERVLGDVSQDEVDQHLQEKPELELDGTKQREEKSTQGLISQPRILLVEDDEDQRAIYGSIFESEMFDVLTAKDGRDALEKLMKERVDVVICDMMMPGIDGLTFIKRLRRHKETSSLPVLMLTAAGSEENELAGIDIGADDFLSKTTSVNVLLARVRRLLERSQAN